MIITVMTVTYCGMSVFIIGMLLLNIGYFWSCLLKTGLLLSSIGFGVLIGAGGLSQYAGSDEVILFSSSGGCTGLITMCAVQKAQTAEKSLVPKS